MNTKFKISNIIAVTTCLVVQTSTQPAAAADETARDIKLQTDRMALGKMEKASKIIGKEVKDNQNNKIGRVKDLAIDVQNGRIAEVIVGVGGVLGVDERFTAVPPREFTCNGPDEPLQLNVDKSRFDAAPVFKFSEWNPATGREKITEVYTYYGSQPYFNSPADITGKENAKPLQLGQVERASRVIGKSVRNLQDERIGRVENLLVNLPDGRVVEVVVGTGGFLGIDSELSAVPPQSFRIGAKDTLTLDATKDSLANAPHFNSRDWTSVNDESNVTAVYQRYNVEPYFTATNANNTALNARDRSGNTLTPLQQGTSESDVAITRQIRKALIDAKDLSIDAQNIKVITFDGKVTLRGPVKNQAEKERVAQIAATVVTNPANINNQLEVEGGPTANAQ